MVGVLPEIGFLLREASEIFPRRPGGLGEGP